MTMHYICVYNTQTENKTDKQTKDRQKNGLTEEQMDIHVKDRKMENGPTERPTERERDHYHFCDDGGPE